MYWGKHRSVYIAQQLGEYFQAKGKTVKIQHKSLERNKNIKSAVIKTLFLLTALFYTLTGFTISLG